MQPEPIPEVRKTQEALLAVASGPAPPVLEPAEAEFHGRCTPGTLPGHEAKYDGLKMPCCVSCQPNAEGITGIDPVGDHQAGSQCSQPSRLPSKPGLRRHHVRRPSRTNTGS